MSKANSNLSVAPSAAKRQEQSAKEEEDKRVEDSPDNTDHVNIV